MEENEKPLVTEEQIWNIVDFARYANGFGPYMTPDMINSRMKQVNLNPIAATEALLSAAMNDPKNHEENLQAMSQFFEMTSMVYKRLISYSANMLSFDVTYTSNAKAEDYKLPRYKKDLEIAESFLDKFEYRKEFRSATRGMLRNDAYFAAFFDLGEKYILQELPSDYCKITGRWEGGLLFSFNFNWFDQSGVDIDMYPDWFKKKYVELSRKRSDIYYNPSTYKPSLPIDKRGNSHYLSWVDVPPEVGVCFKFSPELATRLPYFTPLFNDLVLQPTMRALQQNMNMAEASKMIIGEVPMLNRDAKATVKDSIAISPALLGKFLSLVKSAISDSIKIAAAPLQNFKSIDFEGNNEMYDSYVRTTLALSGVNTNLIFSSNVKPNVIETQLSLNVDEQLMCSLYEQFEEYMSYQVNLRTKYFKFSFVFEGTDFSINREARFSNAMSLFEKGIVMPQKIAAAMRMKPAELRKHMEEAKANGFMDLLTPPSFMQQKELAEMNIKATEKNAKMNINAQKENVKVQQETAIKTAKTAQKTAEETAEGAGRPQKKVTDLTDEGASTRAQGSNLGKGGKV